MKDHSDIYKNLYEKITKDLIEENAPTIGSFESTLAEAVEANEKPSRKRKTKEEPVTEEVIASEIKESVAEIVE